MDTLYYERTDPRYEANLIVYVRLRSWNPFSNKQAKLIDFSLGGFKIEFLQNLKLKNMEKVILVVPLEGFDIDQSKVIKLKAEIKWYDPLHKQVGGTYILPSKNHEQILQKVITSLAQKNKEAKNNV